MKFIHKRDSWLRFLAFFIVPALVVSFASTHLMKTDPVSAMTLDELTERGGVQIAFVGSSIVKHDINPAIVTEKTGLYAFDLSLPNLGMESMLPLTKLLFDTNHPACTVLMLDLPTLALEDETYDSQTRLLPYIDNPLDWMLYYADLCVNDHHFLERLLPFRLLPVESREDLENMALIHEDPDAYFLHQPPETIDYDYLGCGHLKVTERPSVQAMLEHQPFWNADSGADQPLSLRIRGHLLRMQQLCRENNSRLLVLAAPSLTVRNLADLDARRLEMRLDAFCKEKGIPYYNLALVKNPDLPLLDPYFFDYEHLSGVGADIFSLYLSDLLTRYWAGESIESDFYDSWAAYEASIDFVASAFLYETDAPQGQFAVEADCFTGPQVTPLYRFSLRDAQGAETLLRDYGPEDVLVLDARPAPGSTLVVSACAQGHPEHAPVRFFLPVN